MSEEATEENTEENTEEAKGILVDNEGKEVSIEDVTKGKDETEYPEWLAERFKVGDNWAENLNSSYQELSKTLKEKGKIAPDSYELDESVEIDSEDEVYTGFQDFAKENNLSNDQFNNMLKFAGENGLLEADNYEDELGKLGKEGEEIIGGLQSYAKSKLSPEEASTLESMVFTADQARLLNKIVRSDNGNIPAKVGVPASSKGDLQGELDQLMNDPALRTDASKKRKAEELATAIASMK